MQCNKHKISLTVPQWTMNHVTGAQTPASSWDLHQRRRCLLHRIVGCRLHLNHKVQAAVAQPSPHPALPQDPPSANRHSPSCHDAHSQSWQWTVQRPCLPAILPQTRPTSSESAGGNEEERPDQLDMGTHDPTPPNPSATTPPPDSRESLQICASAHRPRHSEKTCQVRAESRCSAAPTRTLPASD